MLTEEDIDMLKRNFEYVTKCHNDTFEQLKYYSSQQIADILIKAHNNGLLAICGGLFSEKETDECFVALMIVIKMLKTNRITLNGFKLL